MPLAADRLMRTVGRLFDVLERRLREAPYLAGDDCSVADVVCYRWLGTLADRPGVRRGMSIAPNTMEPAR